MKRDELTDGAMAGVNRPTLAARKLLMAIVAASALWQLSTASVATPLTDAVDAGDISLVRVLINQGAQVNEKAEDGSAPLHHILSIKYTGDLAAIAEIAEYLIEHGANIDEKDGTGNTFLFSIVAAEAAVSAKKRDGQQPGAEEQRRIADFRTAATTIVTMLLDRGADANAKSAYGGATPLLLSALGLDNTISKLLIAKGANVNAQTDEGLTPLHFAAATGSEANATLLIAHGAKVNARIKSGETPLAIAIKEKHPEVAALIRAAGGTE
ncbi:MAG TPA: ankyrin repeat domain-containing protein [Gallionellaceae bacterium]